MKTKLMILTAVATIAFAQGPRGGRGPMAGGFGANAAPSVDSLKTYLNLTDSQITALQAIRTQQGAANQETRTELQTKQKALAELLASSSPDPAAVGKLILEIQALRKSLSSNRTSLQDQAVALLTADQKAKLKNLEAAAALRDEIRQAIGLFLLAPPSDGPGPFGMGPGMMGMGPGMMGMGFGRN